MGGIIAKLVAQKIAGKALGLVVSKTAWGASGISGAALWAAVPKALEGDAEAIGQIVMAAGGWVLTLYGRWRAGK